MLKRCILHSSLTSNVFDTRDYYAHTHTRALLDSLQAREDAGVRARKNTPAVVTEDGSVQIVVEDGKRVGHEK